MKRRTLGGPSGGSQAALPGPSTKGGTGLVVRGTVGAPVLRVKGGVVQSSGRLSVRDAARRRAQDGMALITQERAINEAIGLEVGKMNVKVVCVLDKTASTTSLSQKMTADAGRLIALLNHRFREVELLPVAVRGGNLSGIDVVIGGVNASDFFASTTHRAYNGGSPLGYGVVDSVNAGFLGLDPDSKTVDAMVVLGDAHFEHDHRYDDAQKTLRDGGAIYAGFYQTAYGESGIGSYRRSIVDGSTEDRAIVVDADGSIDPILDIANIIGVAAENRAKSVVQATHLSTFGATKVNPALFQTSSLAIGLSNSAVSRPAIGGGGNEVRSLTYIG